MNSKEIAELKRALSDKRETVRSITGYYINGEGAVIAKFTKSCALMGEDERGQYLAIFRKILSGGQNKNLFDIPFTTKEVSEGEAHKRLMTLRKDEGFDETAADGLAAKIASAYKSDDNYVILLAKNRCDVIKHSKNDSDGEENESNEVFTFFDVAVCPVKATHSALAYNADEKAFDAFAGVHSISAPEVGFVFPAFDNRQTNIYDALFYTRSVDNPHADLLLALFAYEKPIMTAKEQNVGFKETLTAALGDSLSFDVAKNLHKEIADKIELHKESRDPEPLTMNKEQITDCLAATGITDEAVKKFAETFGESLGSTAELNPKNLISPSKFEIKTPDVTVRVAKGKEELVVTKIIGGVPYLLIRADGEVELNGLIVNIGQETSGNIVDHDN